MSNRFKYRLTVTFKSGRQWRIGVEARSIGAAVAAEIGRNAGDIATICLSDEDKGIVFWLKDGKEFLN